MQLGISSYTFPWAVGVAGHRPERPLDENGLLEKAGEYRVKLLQIGDNLPLHKFEPARLEQLGKRAAAQGIQLEVGARPLTAERATDYVTIAKTVEARLIRFVIDDTDYHPDPKTIIGILHEIAPLLGSLRLAIENHDRFPAATLREIIEKVGSDRIGICLDTANSLGAGEGIEYVAGMLAPVTMNLHVKDFWIERVPHLMGFSVTGRPAGAGMLNLPGLLKQLAPFQRCQSAVLELWTPPEAELQETIAKEKRWATESLSYLKRYFT